MKKVLAVLVAFLVIILTVMAAARPPRSEVRTFEATFPSVGSGADVTASNSVRFDAVSGAWDNPSIKWQKFIESTQADFTIADTNPSYYYEGPAYMSSVTRTTLKGTDILWVVSIRTEETELDNEGNTISQEYWISQKESEHLITSYDKLTDIWYINFNGAYCVVNKVTTTPAGFRSSVRLGDCDPKTFSMTIARIPK